MYLGPLNSQVFETPQHLWGVVLEGSGLKARSLWALKKDLFG